MTFNGMKDGSEKSTTVLFYDTYKCRMEIEIAFIFLFHYTRDEIQTIFLVANN